ncbi:TIGR01244 family phosphatase [Sphingomonas piscis]|uniref:TIGR01244 family phosphatase n=1 Tax=Sphingomonas piscis TaxID=2714943 RepID=A0A6G7YPG0_9SPHN|nr:TIGR01244 family sulfur transferase [Sphingomonas piscis]QIK78617.1 TIGR01244 family phosphatase [Sphingomonas piscis]
MHQLDDKTLVSGQILPEQVAGLKSQGITAIVNNRPDDEEPGQPAAAEIKAAAEAAGLSYCHIPIARGIGPADAEAMRDAINGAEGKVLAFCRSGARSTYAWAVAQAGEGRARDEIEAAAARAGYDLAPVAHLL